MAKLSDGRVIKPDFTLISTREYRLLFADETTPEAQDDLIGRVYGMSGEELVSLSWYDYKLITSEFLAAARDPVNFDPN